ncbi:MAG TPA: MBOAT family O-acyltransferase [Candidatus Baltobacteraceae bacterium]
MLFNSFVFLFAFLPVTLVVFFWLGARGYRRTALGWLGVMSCVFYAYWKPSYLVLLLASIGFNYLVGRWIAQTRPNFPARAKALVIAGVAANLLALCVFKYADLLVSSVGGILGRSLPLPAIVLPLAISFFTFNQIAYLVDVYQGEAQEPDFLTYLLFVSFFPHLIAGPIVHHEEMIPQFRTSALRYNSDDMAAGVTIFSLGLFKKVAFADTIAPFTDSVFATAVLTPMTFAEAWLAALAYGLQLYFDFSGYSDMAIGLARMFGIRFPLNFFSPYQARDISDFWRRWHMTLSRFLRDYLYIPLGGNRFGTGRRYVSLMLTMLLGGLWHGASWTYVIWGGLHGTYLVVHHGWRAAIERFAPQRSLAHGPLGIAMARAVTLLAVVFAWVCFRSPDFHTTVSLWSSMLAMHGLGHPTFAHVNPGHKLIAFIVILLVAVLVAPNTEQFMNRYHHSFGAEMWDRMRNRLGERLQWAPTARWATAFSLLATTGIVLSIHSHTFLYFQF